MKTRIWVLALLGLVAAGCGQPPDPQLPGKPGADLLESLRRLERGDWQMSWNDFEDRYATLVVSKPRQVDAISFGKREKFESPVVTDLEYFRRQYFDASPDTWALLKSREHFWHQPWDPPTVHGMEDLGQCLRQLTDLFPSEIVVPGKDREKEHTVTPAHPNFNFRNMRPQPDVVRMSVDAPPAFLDVLETRFSVFNRMFREIEPSPISTWHGRVSAAWDRYEAEHPEEPDEQQTDHAHEASWKVTREAVQALRQWYVENKDKLCDLDIWWQENGHRFPMLPEPKPKPPPEKP